MADSTASCFQCFDLELERNFDVTKFPGGGDVVFSRNFRNTFRKRESSNFFSIPNCIHSILFHLHAFKKNVAIFLIILRTAMLPKLASGLDVHWVRTSHVVS